jgi:hypothetical protein
MGATVVVDQPGPLDPPKELERVERRDRIGNWVWILIDSGD